MKRVASPEQKKSLERVKAQVDNSVGFDPSSYAQSEEPSFDPSSYAKDLGSAVALSEGSPVKPLYRQFTDPLDAASLGAIDTMLLNSYIPSIEKFGTEKGKERLRYLQKEEPGLVNAGKILGAAKRGTPFSAAMDIAEAPVKKLAPMAAKKLADLIPGAVPKTLMSMADKIGVGWAVKPTANLAKFAAEVPAKIGSQQAMLEAAKIPFGKQDFSNVAKAVQDPMSLALGYGGEGIGNALRKSEIPKHLYSATGPINPRAVERYDDAGRDLIQEAMDKNYFGGFKGIKSKAIKDQELINNARQETIRKAKQDYDRTGRGEVSREEMLQPITDRVMELWDQAATPSEMGAGADLYNRLRGNMANKLDAADVEKQLRAQKAYVRGKKSERSTDEFYSGAPAAQEMQYRREFITKGLKTQEKQIADNLGKRAGEEFRKSGRDYGLAREMERSARQAQSKYGNWKSPISAGGTTAATGLNYLLNKGVPLQNYITVMRELQNQGIPPEEAAALVKQVTSE